MGNHHWKMPGEGEITTDRGSELAGPDSCLLEPGAWLRSQRFPLLAGSRAVGKPQDLVNPFSVTAQET